MTGCAGVLGLMLDLGSAVFFVSIASVASAVSPIQSCLLHEPLSLDLNLNVGSGLCSPACVSISFASPLAVLVFSAIVFEQFAVAGMDGRRGVREQ